MTTEIQKQNNVPEFVREKLATLEGALTYAQTLCKSKILPAHFYEKGADGKPDFNKGKAETVVVVLQYGQEIGMTHMQALQQLVPVNNLVSIKGDGAKALILGSGKAEKWQENEIGSPGKDDWGFKVTAKRRDTGEESSATFTVFDAKRAGLWIDDTALAKNPGMRHSPWFKFPRRMLRYRALGFIARDMFSDVLQGVHIEEEIDATINVDAKVVNADGIQADLVKAEITETRTAEVLDKVKTPELKPAPTKRLPKEEKKAVAEEAKVVEEPKSKPQPPAVTDLTPQQIKEELEKGIPFIVGLFDRGLPKTLQMGRALVAGLRNGTLEQVLIQSGVEYKDLMYPEPTVEDKPEPEQELSESPSIESTFDFGSTPRDMIKCAEIADHLDNYGIDIAVVAEGKNMDVMEYLTNVSEQELVKLIEEGHG